ncbi:MAG: hypothetical protein KME40_22120 [Komarekiella atlantica HA4396-MV6]|nr:hypothetical protein [Komarekiella atlantica HA4396-MV6]
MKKRRRTAACQKRKVGSLFSYGRLREPVGCGGFRRRKLWLPPKTRSVS